jgi:hypothetical protein
LQARDRNIFIVHWNRYGQRRISREFHRDGVLQAQHSRFQKKNSSDERDRWWQGLQSRQSDKINFFEDLTESVLPLGPPA